MWAIMNTKAVAGVVIAVVVIGVTGVLVFLNPAPVTLFHIEDQLPEDLTLVSLFFVDVEDTNLSISFVDDDTLFYSMDIALYEPTTAQNAFRTRWWAVSAVFRFDALTRIRSLNVTLGTGVQYSFGVWGDNLNSLISYDNGAQVGDDIRYEASGEFLLRLTEDVTMNTNVSIHARGTGLSSMLHALYLDINLKTGVGGVLHIGSIPISFVDRVGWIWDGFDSYDTAPGNPTVRISADECDHIYANLLN